MQTPHNRCRDTPGMNSLRNMWWFLDILLRYGITKSIPLANVHQSRIMGNCIYIAGEVCHRHSVLLAEADAESNLSFSCSSWARKLCAYDSEPHVQASPHWSTVLSANIHSRFKGYALLCKSIIMRSNLGWNEPLVDVTTEVATAEMANFGIGRIGNIVRDGKNIQSTRIAFAQRVTGMAEPPSQFNYQKRLSAKNVLHMYQFLVIQNRYPGQTPSRH